MGHICDRKIQQELLITNILFDNFWLREVPKPQIIRPRKVFWRNTAIGLSCWYTLLLTFANVCCQRQDTGRDSCMEDAEVGPHAQWLISGICSWRDMLILKAQMKFRENWKTEERKGTGKTPQSPAMKSSGEVPYDCPPCGLSPVQPVSRMKVTKRRQKTFVLLFP